MLLGGPHLPAMALEPGETRPGPASLGPAPCPLSFSTSLPSEPPEQERVSWEGFLQMKGMQAPPTTTTTRAQETGAPRGLLWGGGSGGTREDRLQGDCLGPSPGHPLSGQLLQGVQREADSSLGPG